MRRFSLGLTSISAVVLMVAAPSAVAGNCGVSGGLDCNPGVVYNPAGAPSFDPLTVNVRQPLQGLRSVNIHTAPSVNITRLYGQNTLASVSDRPSGFTGGCHPTTTQYCRSNVGTPVNVSLNRPQVQAPVYQAPVYSAPVVSPVIRPTVRFSQGYNPAAALPRQYGENIFTPGIVHAPTSYIDRAPETAERLLASGVTRSYNQTSFVSASPYAGGSVQLSTPVGSTVSSTNPTTPVDASGGYWEQVSGPTLFGDTLATQVVCRRQAPQQTVQVQSVPVQQQIVRPVIGVPTPVPVYCESTNVSNRYGFAGITPSAHGQHAPVQHLHAAPQGYGQQGRWTY